MDKIELRKPKFNIGDEVFHVSPGSCKGIILDITYYFSTKNYKYLVTFGINNDCSCMESEIYKK